MQETTSRNRRETLLRGLSELGLNPGSVLDTTFMLCLNGIHLDQEPMDHMLIVQPAWVECSYCSEIAFMLEPPIKIELDVYGSEPAKESHYFNQGDHLSIEGIVFGLSRKSWTLVGEVVDNNGTQGPGLCEIFSSTPPGHSDEFLLEVEIIRDTKTLHTTNQKK